MQLEGKLGGRGEIVSQSRCWGGQGAGRRCQDDEDGELGGGQKSVKFQGSCHSPQGPHLPHSETGLSNVPGSTLQAQMSLDVQIGALPPWRSSLSLSLPPAPPQACKEAKQRGQEGFMG